MLFSFLAIIAGFVLLAWGADRFVLGASAIARNLGVSPLLIGLTIVGLGTSAPEILVSANAALSGNSSLAIGNALGSNIANIGLIIGVTVLVQPLVVRSKTLNREFALLFGVSFLPLLLLMDGDLDRWDGVIFLAILAFSLFYLTHIGKKRSSEGELDPMGSEFDAEIPKNMPLWRAALWFLVGLVVMVGGSETLVWGAVQIAQAMGVSDLIIGLTIVAIGTSLPELAASITSVLKKEDDLALGNVIGSNLYNILAVLSMPALIAPAAIPEDALYRDTPIMLLMTAALYLAVRGQGQPPAIIARWEGVLLFAAFIAYQSYLFIASS